MMIKDVGDRVYKLREKELDNPQASHNQFLAEVLVIISMVYTNIIIISRYIKHY